MGKGGTKQNQPAAMKPAPGTAAGQALGYSLQYTRLTAMLLAAAEGSFCSLEVLDDVASESGGGKHLVQSKSALTSNPVADRATPLWKTFANWVKLAQEGRIIPADTIFEIYVSRQVSGSIVASFDQAASANEVVGAIDAAKATLWGLAPTRSERAGLPPDVRRYSDVAFKSEQTLSEIIGNFQLVCGSGSPHADLEAVLKGHPVSPTKVLGVADHLCGWVKRTVDKLLEQQLPAVLSRDEFHAMYRAYCRRIDRETILASSARRPSQKAALEHLPDVFVQQLDFIDLPYEDKLSAISDFLMAASDRTAWAKAGDVDEESFEELDRSLTRAWTNRRRMTEIEHRTKAQTEQGQLLYSACMQYETQLQAMSTPFHFLPGCFHRLADGQLVGWHPSYKELLDTNVREPA